MSEIPKFGECTCGYLILAASHLDRIADDVRKLRQAVIDGLYDPRSIVGDAVLRMEGQLRQVRELIPTIESQRQEKKNQEEK